MADVEPRHWMLDQACSGLEKLVSVVAKAGRRSSRHQRGMVVVVSQDEHGRFPQLDEHRGISAEALAYREPPTRQLVLNNTPRILIKKLSCGLGPRVQEHLVIDLAVKPRPQGGEDVKE